MTKADLETVLRVLEHNEWHYENAAGNQACEMCQLREDRYKDQHEHHEGCDWVKATNAVRAALEIVQC